MATPHLRRYAGRTWQTPLWRRSALYQCTKDAVPPRMALRSSKPSLSWSASDLLWRVNNDSQSASPTIIRIGSGILNRPLDSSWRLEGTNACPPENVVGAPRYVGFLQIISDSNHPGHDDMLLWPCKRVDPAAFDQQDVNQRLMQIRV
ncbi:IS1096 element passenger TnpR family protein [Achromobacter aegrifaciens]